MPIRDRLRRWIVPAIVAAIIVGCDQSAAASSAGSGSTSAATSPAGAAASPTARTTPNAAASLEPSRASGGSGSDGSVATASPLRLVAIGDSLGQTFSCPGCTDFVHLYGQALAKATGEPVDVDNRSAVHDSALPAVQASSLLNDILVDPGLRDAIRSADVVIVNVGFNDTPWNRYDNPCDASDASATVIKWNLITASCIDRVANEYSQTLDQILSQINELRGCFTPPDQPANFCGLLHKPSTLIRVVTVYDDWIGEDGIDARGLAATQAADAAFVKVQCWMAMMHGAGCADAYHALNGKAGSADAAPFLVDDHTHFNAAGNQRIADTLAALGYAPIG